MLIDRLVENPWLVALSWAVLSLFDFSATMVFAKAYRDFLSSTLKYERGVEMNPMFEKDVNQLRWFSPRYFILMPVAAFLIGFAGTWFPPKLYELLAGTAILLVLVVDLRHIENLSFVWFLKSDPESVKGQIEQSYKLSQRRVAVNAFNTGILYLIVFLLTGRIFFIGGTVVSVLLAFRHFLISRRKLPEQISVD
jgi:hypothetical protein